MAPTTRSSVTAHGRSWWRRLRARGEQEVSASSLAAFRILFGLLMTAGALRFVQSGWLSTQYVEPSFFFKFWGFESFGVPSLTGLQWLYGALAVSAAMVSVGLLYRIAMPLFTVLFAYTEMMDVTNYLNHYVLVVWLSVLLCVSPAHQKLSVDAWLFPSVRVLPMRRLIVWLFRFQLAIVYLYAAWAKVGADWLLHGQPLGLWLAARTDMPLLGPLFSLPGVGLAFSWGGFLYDASIVFWLSRGRTRPYAYAVVVVFHVMTRVLFDIGLFPFIMCIGTLFFFSPSWPDGLIQRVLPSPRTRNSVLAPARFPLAAPLWVLVVGYGLVQVVVPARSVAYGGDVLWHEQGMRFAWKVMVREKNGSITYRVVDKTTERRWEVSPHSYLTWRQVNEMSGQPDLILQLAHHIADDFVDKGRVPSGRRDDVAVYVDAQVSLNGRAPQRLIDPQVDLSTVVDGLAPAPWILPAPDAPPLRAR